MSEHAPDPYEEAADSVEALGASIALTDELAKRTERKVRNAVMQDALDVEPAILKASYPEVPEEIADTAAEEPYQFAVMTEAAALATRIAGALDTIGRLYKELQERQ